MCKHPTAPQVGTLFEKEEATPAVLSLLRETKVSQMVSMAALEEGRGVKERGGGGARPAVSINLVPVMEVEAHKQRRL